MLLEVNSSNILITQNGGIPDMILFLYLLIKWIQFMNVRGNWILPYIDTQVCE